jgi:hypothetical protein
VITNEDAPVKAVRRKKESSIVVGMNMVKNGEGDIFISAGSTGALLAGGMLIIGRVKGIDRPTLATVYPMIGGEPCFLTDTGANSECRPRNLLEFATMGSIYMEKVIGRENPTVGLVNNGTEATKGTALTKQAHALLAKSNLNFIGNEFGHPEWVDFPREGNGWSYHYARRQWSLVRDWNMKFEWLANFDRSMTYFINTHKVHCTGPAESLWIDNERKLMIFARGGRLFAFNLHPTWSQESVFINCRVTGPGGYRVALSTDDWPFGGQTRVDMDYIYHPQETEFGYGFWLYLPCRCGVALEKVEG